MKMIRSCCRVALSSIVIALTPGCENWESVESGSSISFSKQTCEKPNNRSSGPVLGTSSWANNKFVVNVQDNHYCGGSKITEPSYARAGEILELRWKWQTGDLVTKCMCDHNIRFELSNLPVREYKVRLRRTN